MHLRWVRCINSAVSDSLWCIDLSSNLPQLGFGYAIRAWILLCYPGLDWVKFSLVPSKFMLFFCDGFAIYLRYTDIFTIFHRYTDNFCVVSEVSQHICVVSEVSRHKSTDVDAEIDEEQRWDFRNTQANNSVPNAKTWIWITELLRKNLWEYAQRQKFNQDTILNLKNRWICTEAGSENSHWHIRTRLGLQNHIRNGEKLEKSTQCLSPTKPMERLDRKGLSWCWVNKK